MHLDVCEVSADLLWLMEFTSAKHGKSQKTFLHFEMYAQPCGHKRHEKYTSIQGIKSFQNSPVLSKRNLSTFYEEQDKRYTNRRMRVNHCTLGIRFL